MMEYGKYKYSLERGVILDKNLLLHMYDNKLLTIEEIASELGFNSTKPIYRNFKHHGIKTKGIGYFSNLRGSPKKSKINYTNKQYHFFDGLIVSDGCIQNTANFKKYISPFITCSFKYEEFAKYISGKLDCRTYESHSVDLRRKVPEYVSYNVRGPSDVFFVNERKRWYDEDNKKFIPDDFRFSPISMNIWYLGDGTLASVASCRKAIELCTQSFTKDNLDKTVIKFLHSLGIDCWVNNAVKVYIPARSANKFLDYIGVCPVSCYKHKWNIGEESLRNKVLDKDNLYDLYITKKYSSRKIASMLGRSKHKITNDLKKHNIPIRNRK